LEEENIRKSSFILHNYVISPLIQNKCEETRNPFDVKVIYLNTRKNVKSTIERMIVNYNSKKTTVQNWCSIIVRIRNHIKLSTTKAKEMITSTMSTFDQLSDKGILSAISARKSLYEIDNLIRSSMEEYGDLDEETGEFTYKEEHSKLIPIIAIDVTGIFY
jgi:sugar-specific transcriptional regulator TrmB